MRKFLFIFSLWLGFAPGAPSAINLELTDGAVLIGDIIKFDDNGLMLRLPGESYTNLNWTRFSQDALKQLAGNPKIQPLVESFIEPTEAQRPPKPEIKVQPVTRLERPGPSSVLGGLADSGLGWFIFLLLYAANVYAGFEVAVFRGRPIAHVMGLAAVLPVIGPIIFLSLPVKMEAPPEDEAALPAAAGTEPIPLPTQEIQIASSSWKQEEEAKLKPQVFARGKYTFNRRFIETKFAAFIGGAQGEEAKQYTMEVTTARERLAVVRILHVGPDTAVLDAVQRGSVTVAFKDIQEIKLNPKTA